MQGWGRRNEGKEERKEEKINRDRKREEGRQLNGHIKTNTFSFLQLSNGT